MAELEIREVCFADIPRVEVIEQASFTDPYPHSLLLALALSHPSTFLIASLKGEVIGYVAATVEGAGSAHLASIAVDPAYRARGVARQLLNSILAALRKHGVNRVRLEVRESNLAAQNLYKSLGFQYCDRIKGYYDDGEDAVVMILHF